MQARKVAYVIALVAVELLAPNNAEAGGVRELVPTSVEAPSTVTISQEEYRTLIKDQMLLQMYESGEKTQGNAVSLVEANQIVEEALAQVDSLQQENEELRGLLSSADEEIEPVPVPEPEVSFRRYGIGGGILTDFESLGGYVDGEYDLSDRIGITASVMYLDSLVLSTGVRYRF